MLALKYKCLNVSNTIIRFSTLIPKISSVYIRCIVIINKCKEPEHQDPISKFSAGFDPSATLNANTPKPLSIKYHPLNT